jgi:protein-disulfide isomerase
MPLLEKYGSKIRFEYVQFPLQSIHAYAYKAALASECAADQGKFWEYVDLNYEKQEELPSAPYETWAQSLGLNADTFHRCFASGIKGTAVDADIARGNALKVNSTPSYFVNGVKVDSNTMDDLSKAIDMAFLQASKTPL